MYVELQCTQLLLCNKTSANFNRPAGFYREKKLLKEKRKLRVWKYKWLPWQAISVCKFVFFSSIARCMSQAFEKVNQSIDID